MHHLNLLFHCTKYTAERQKTFETIKTKTNIALSINENINENLKLLSILTHLAP